MRDSGDWPLGLARMAQFLGRDLQRPARAAGGPERLWRATRAELGRHLRCAGLELDGADRFRRQFDPVAEAGRLAAEGIVHIGMDDTAYPADLLALPDPPFGLFARGAADEILEHLRAGPTVAVVGS